MSPVRLVDDHQRGVRPGDAEYFSQRSRVPVHGVNAFYHHEYVCRSVGPLRAKSPKRGVEVLDVVVAEHNGLLLSPQSVAHLNVRDTARGERFRIPDTVRIGSSVGAVAAFASAVTDKNRGLLSRHVCHGDLDASAVGVKK